MEYFVLGNLYQKEGAPTLLWVLDLLTCWGSHKARTSSALESTAQGCWFGVVPDCCVCVCTHTRVCASVYAVLLFRFLLACGFHRGSSPESNSPGLFVVCLFWDKISLSSLVAPLKDNVHSCCFILGIFSALQEVTILGWWCGHWGPQGDLVPSLCGASIGAFTEPKIERTFRILRTVCCLTEKYTEILLSFFSRYLRVSVSE